MRDMTPFALQNSRGRNRARAIAISVARRRDQAYWRWLLLLPVLAALLVWAAAAQARSAPESFADLAEMLLPAVVNLSSTQTVQEGVQADELDEFFKDFFDRHRREGQPRRATPLGPRSHEPRVGNTCV